MTKAVELLWQTLLGFGMLLVWGGLLAGVTLLVPRLLDYLEPAPLSAPLGVGPRERPAPPEPPPVAEPVRAPAPEPARPKVIVPTEDPALAAAVAVALALYLEGSPEAPASPPPAAGPGNVWALYGRWQAMQQRRDLRKRK